MILSGGREGNSKEGNINNRDDDFGVLVCVDNATLRGTTPKIHINIILPHGFGFMADSG